MGKRTKGQVGRSKGAKRQMSVAEQVESTQEQRRQRFAKRQQHTP